MDNKTLSGSSGAMPPTPQQPEGEDLFAARKKIYVRSTTGVFATWRWVLVWATQLLFFILPWLTWNGRQAFLLDIAQRKFYIFGWVFWPQDVLFLALLLMISAYSLFFFTAIAGRLWCGYACPQTVYTEIFMWIEQKIEGDRNKRMRLDQAPMSGRKFAIKGAKFLAWGLFSLWTGFTFVAYFSPLKELLHSAVTFSFGPWEWFWIFFYGAFTFLLAGMLREQVCRYMCPYARFQGVMFDPDTLIITYDQERGEQRGPRRKGEDYKAEGKGDCIDCNICVQVCPTGIDIRNGLQYECIGCAACIDACDQVMDRMGYPHGLVRYTTENAVKNKWSKKQILSNLLRPRTLVYSAILILFCCAFVWGLATREPLRVDVIRDRASLGREVEDGLIENIYRLQIMNMTESPRSFAFDVHGLDGIRIDGTKHVEIGPTETESASLRVLAPMESGKPGANEMYFEIQAEDDPSLKLREKSTFFIP